VIAIRPKTGEIACFYQFTPNDVYDVDGVDELALADIQVGGRPRKVMIQANKNGFLYVIDRTNCQLIAANPLVKVNWASSIDIESGRPVLTDVYKRFFAGERWRFGPSRGTNAVPIAFDPREQPRVREHVGHPAPPENRCAETTGARRGFHRRDRADT
jgi:alcohol dehydrogenase (cytochrome c)